MMPKEPKFKPEITRIKLNPEQAVLTCNCYDDNTRWLVTSAMYASVPTSWSLCSGKTKEARTPCVTTESAISGSSYEYISVIASS